MKQKNPTADMLRTTLAQSESLHDMRLNPALSPADIAETIRIAIECIEGIEVPAKVLISCTVVARFAGSVQGLFTSDPEWSLYDLDGAKEFFEAAGIDPDKDALTVRD